MSRRDVKVLVTGARGYIGGRLILHLVKRGFQVIGTTRRDASPPSRWPAGVPLIRLNPSDDPAVTQSALRGVNTIIHLAAANEISSAADPEVAMFETGGGTRRLLETAIAAGVQRFLFMSTVHIYGSPLSGRLEEGSLPRPSHPYAITHLVGESYVSAASAARRIEGISVRLSNGIGAPAWRDVDRWTLVGNDFARQASETGEIIVKTPGQWRDFVSLSDACSGIEILLTVPAGALCQSVFNLGGDMPLRIIDVAQHTCAAAKMALTRPVTIRTIEEIPPNEPPPFEIRIAAMRALGFSPTGIVGLDQELLATFHLLKA